MRNCEAPRPHERSHDCSHLFSARVEPVEYSFARAGQIIARPMRYSFLYASHRCKLRGTFVALAVVLTLVASDANAEEATASAEAAVPDAPASRVERPAARVHAFPPEGFTVETQPRWRFVRIGALMFGIAYGVTALGSAQALTKPGADGAWAWGFAPVLGPLVGIAYLHTDGFPEIGLLVDACLVADALVQAVGASLLVYGIASPQRVLVPKQDALWRFVPRPIHLGPGRVVFGVAGTF
jgi:hypothetical protein